MNDFLATKRSSSQRALVKNTPYFIKRAILFYSCGRANCSIPVSHLAGTFRFLISRVSIWPYALSSFTSRCDHVTSTVSLAAYSCANMELQGIKVLACSRFYFFIISYFRTCLYYFLVIYEKQQFLKKAGNIHFLSRNHPCVSWKRTLSRQVAKRQSEAKLINILFLTKRESNPKEPWCLNYRYKLTLGLRNYALQNQTREFVIFLLLFYRILRFYVQ